MTMPRGASRTLYAGNGQAAEFPFFFRVFEEDQLSVLVTSPGGVTSEATGWSAELDENGGTVRYLHNGAPLPEGWKLAIMRDMPFVQEVDLITGTRFDPEVIETALDVATAERQQLLEGLSRAVKVDIASGQSPEELLGEIFAARGSAAASATSAQASANAAADSARAAAGSAAVATEQREAACICAGEAKDARDVAIAQAEAANTLMEAELAKVNAVVAANKTDQQAAVTAARQWAEKAPDTPVDYDEEGNPRYSARHWAENAQKIAIEPPTAERRGAIRVGAGLHLTTGENGETDVLVSDRMNSELWLTESGQWTAPADGWYAVLCIAGGRGAFVHTANKWGAAGESGEWKEDFRYYHAGDTVEVVIGAGGLKNAGTSHVSPNRHGGDTSFDDITALANFISTTPKLGYGAPGATNNSLSAASFQATACGGGPGGTTGAPRFYGAGGGCSLIISSSFTYEFFDGYQGAVRLRYCEPAKNSGPVATLFAARRMAPRAGSAPGSVCLYDPETGQGSVWREEDAAAKIAEGLITEAAWREMCAEKAAEEYAAWLADPATEAERFALLRAEREARLAATDYLVAPDYPLDEKDRTTVIACRQALRDLPAQEGAPWDGGGSATPWPAEPVVAKAGEA